MVICSLNLQRYQLRPPPWKVEVALLWLSPLLPNTRCPLLLPYCFCLWLALSSFRQTNVRCKCLLWIFFLCLLRYHQFQEAKMSDLDNSNLPTSLHWNAPLYGKLIVCSLRDFSLSYATIFPCLNCQLIVQLKQLYKDWVKNQMQWYIKVNKYWQQTS